MLSLWMTNSYEGKRQTSFWSLVWQSSKRAWLPLAVRRTTTRSEVSSSLGASALVAGRTTSTNLFWKGPVTATMVGSYERRTRAVELDMMLKCVSGSFVRRGEGVTYMRFTVQIVYGS
jgi:hypothetical protein